MNEKLTSLAVESTETSWACALVSVGTTDLAGTAIHAWVVRAGISEDLTVIARVTSQTLTLVRITINLASTSVSTWEAGTWIII